jgi:hypothetical protein
MTMPPGRAGLTTQRPPAEVAAMADRYAEVLDAHRADTLPQIRADAIATLFKGWEYWDTCEVKRVYQLRQT